MVFSHSVTRKWPNTEENGCWLPPSDHNQSETLFQTRQDQEIGMNSPASLLHSWHWVLFTYLSGNKIFWTLLSLAPPLMKIKLTLCHSLMWSSVKLVWSVMNLSSPELSFTLEAGLLCDLRNLPIVVLWPKTSSCNCCNGLTATSTH